MRMAVFSIGANIYAIKDHYKNKKRGKRLMKSFPDFSVIIPAHNEALTVASTLDSLAKVRYPKSKLEIIVVDDGSTDDTLQILQAYKSTHVGLGLKILSQPNKGKAHAMNNAIRNCATGELIMCLDADSELDSNALREAAAYFSDDRVIAMSANVKIKATSSLLNIIQQIEYLIGYQIKQALNVFNSEYVVGGVGSVFRKSALVKVAYYDTDTITEDMDLTLKLISLGNKDYHVGYSSRVIAYTESVLSVKDLVKQRYRWKYGRMQTFVKYRSLFFNSDRRYSKTLTWFYLPYILLGDLLCFIEPFMVMYVLVRTIYYQDWASFIVTCAVLAVYIAMNILSDDSMPWRMRIKYLLAAPLGYFLFYVLNYVEYIALLKVIFKAREIRISVTDNKFRTAKWQHVERAGVKV
jgi:poly-beta-1,6-N-acetyl-D-glucosamine synthase